MDAINVATSVPQILEWMPDTIKLFTEAPAVYFVALALVSGIIGVSRKLVPLKKR